MAGRYTGWHHKKGGVEIPPEDLAAGRKVLGELQNQLALGGNPSGFRRVLLPNGTLIKAAITMGQPVLNIVPGRGGRRMVPARELGEFITVPRSAAAPAGVDPDHPEVMLRHGPSLWRSYFFSETPAGFTSQGGTYVDMFPGGLGQGGTVDWVGPDGERLSWYGPSSRAFADAYVHARFQHGKRVFYLGDVLLDTDEYFAASELDPGAPERYVAGAALRKVGTSWWLYVMQYAGTDGETPAGVVGSSTLDEFYSYPLAAQPAFGGLHRYKLYRWTDPQGLVRFSVARNSREKLRTIVTGSPDPWFFNRECTEMVCHLALTTTNAPGKPWWAANVPVRDNPPDVDDDIPAGTFHGPATAAIVWRLAIAENGTTTTNTATAPSVTSGGAAAPVTGDYDFETGALVTYGIRFGADLVPYFVFDGAEAALYQSTRAVGAGTGGDDIITGVCRWILYANPRDHVVVLLRKDIQFDTGAAPQLQYQRHTIELYRDGELVHSEQVTDTPNAKSGFIQRWGDSTDALDYLAGHSITPQWFIYGLLVTYRNTYDPPGPPEPGDENTWTSEGQFIGANPMYAQLPYPAQCWFGIADASIPPGQAAQTIASLNTAGFNGALADDNGHFAVTGAARHDDVVLVSCWVPKDGMAASYTHITDGDLQDLTTVGGADARYHPIRLLGKMPVEDREEGTDQ